LHLAGYHTASISPFPQRHTAYQIWYGFAEMHDTGKGGLDNADEVYPFVQRWLQENGKGDNWFLHVNFWDPHTPYDTPAAFGNPFADEPIEDWLTQAILDEQNRSFGPHSATEVPGFGSELPAAWRMGVGQIHTLAEAKAHLDGYDTGIRYADEYVGRVLADLARLGIGEETAVIISADHGENQGELNVWGDHQTADLITNRLPLIVQWPGLTDKLAGTTVDGLYYHLDLGATVVELLGGQRPSTWDGRSFAPAFRGQATGRDTLVLSQGAWSCQRAVRWANWLLIRTYHTGLKEFPAYMLFDATADPHETTNLAAQQPEMVTHGLRLLDEWVGQYMADAWRGDPFWGVIAEGGPFHANVHSPEWCDYVQRLRETGRTHHAEKLERFGGRPFTTGIEEGEGHEYRGK
jgi:arylsulfatase A-like enzyme